MWNSGPGWCRGAYWTTYCFGLLGWKFISWFFIKNCNVFFMDPGLEHFYSRPYTFSLMLGKFACSWPFWPYFIVLSTMNFLSQLSFGCSSAKVHGCIFHNLLFWKTCFGICSLFFITSCKVFLSSTSLGHFLQWALSSFPYVGKLPCSWPFWPYFHSVFCYGFPSWAQFWLFN